MIPEETYDAERMATPAPVTHIHVYDCGVKGFCSCDNAEPFIGRRCDKCEATDTW